MRCAVNLGSSDGVLCARRVRQRQRESEIGRGRRLRLERAQTSKARRRKWGSGKRGRRRLRLHERERWLEERDGADGWDRVGRERRRKGRGGCRLG